MYCALMKALNDVKQEDSYCSCLCFAAAVYHHYMVLFLFVYSEPVFLFSLFIVLGFFKL